MFSPPSEPFSLHTLSSSHLSLSKQTRYTQHTVITKSFGFSLSLSRLMVNFVIHIVQSREDKKSSQIHKFRNHRTVEIINTLHLRWYESVGLPGLLMTVSSLPSPLPPFPSPLCFHLTSRLRYSLTLPSLCRLSRPPSPYLRVSWLSGEQLWNSGGGTEWGRGVRGVGVKRGMRRSKSGVKWREGEA